MILIKQGNTTLYTVNNYTYTEAEMGESNITLKLSVPVNMQIVVVGQPEVDVLAPAFALDWYVEENGEKFYLTTDKPQGSKSTGSLDYIYDLIFDSERSALKKRMVKDLASLGSDTFVSQGLIFKLTNATITTFAQLIQNNLTDCFGTKWAIVINPAIISSVTATVLLEVSNTYIWDLLLRIYEFYGLRWKIQSINGVMTIRVGYDAVEIPHIFEYGSETGLTTITRQITDTKVINRLRGTGGTRNLPTNYFTDRYSGFDPDPNVLAGMFSFKNLMPKCFRDSVIAHNANNLLPLIDYVTLPNIPAGSIIEDGLEPNEEIYPSIEGVSVAGLGRIDEIVAVESTNFDDPEYKSSKEFTGITSVANVYTGRVGTTDESTKIEYTNVFMVSDAKNIVCQLNLQYRDQYNNIVPPPYTYKIPDGTSVVTIGNITEISTKLELIDVATGLVVGSATKMFYDTANLTKELDTTKDIEYKNLPVGSYKFKLTNVANGNVGANNRTMKFSAVGVLTNIKNVSGIYKPTFDIWVKDIQFDLAATGTDGVAKYASTEDGIIAFKSGSLAGYEFKILKVSTESNVFACVPDTSKSLNGVPSKYRITLIKNDTEYQAGSQMLPNVAVHAVPADQFAILGINMPFSYVTLAEERLQAYLSEQLIIASKLYPTYNVGLLDIFLQENPDITDDIRSGNKFRIRDKRLTDGDMSLYINAVTIEHSGLLPKYNVTVTDKVTVNGSTVQRISSQIDAISAGQYAGQQSLEMSIANLDKRYLRKNIEDVAYEEIDLKGGVKASTIKTENFEQGQLSGSGMGVFKDPTGATVLEVDKLTVRDTAVFNEVVINQIKFQGGIVVYSAANMEVIKVETDTVFFDLKRGTVQNQFAVNDIIRCQRWVEGVQVKYYMSVVVEVGVDYIKLSTTTTDGVLNPSESDIIVQFGNTTDVLRQAVIEVDVLNGGKQTFYQGLNSFVTTNKNTIDIGRVQDTDNVWKTMMRVYGDAYIGARDLSSYMKFNSTTQQLDIAASLKFIAPDGSLKSVSDTFTGFDSLKQNAVVNGKTIIVGGYINTELIRADLIIANHILTAETGERIALNIGNDNAMKIYDTTNVMRMKLGYKDNVPAFIFYDAAGVETFNLSSLGVGGSLNATGSLIFNNGVKTATINIDNNGNLVVNGDLHVTGNIFSDKEITAFGLGTGSGGSGGLIQTVYSYSNLGGSFSNATLTDTFNAYTINQMNNRLIGVENGALTQISSALVTNALGYVPYNSSNPNGYITSSALSSKLDYRTFGTAANNNTGDFYATGSTVANSTSWSGQSYNNGGIAGSMPYLLGYDNTYDRFAQATQGQVQSFLGLGSAAYENISNFIQNNNSSAQSANMWISGVSKSLRHTVGDGINVGYLDFAPINNVDSRYWRLRTDLTYYGDIVLQVSADNGSTFSKVLGIEKNGNATFASTVNATQIQSTVATGTAPLTVNSTTMVENLKAQYLGYNVVVGNANMQTNAGAYYYNTGSLNTPASGRLLHLGYDGNTWSSQILITEGNNKIYFREQNNSTWQSWNEIYHSGNLTNNLSTNYIPKWNGSTMVNSLISDDGTIASVGGGLHINRSSIPFIRLRNTSGDRWGMFADFDESGSFSLYSYISNSTRLKIQGNGDTNISSTTPSTAPTNGALVVGGGIGALGINTRVTANSDNKPSGYAGAGGLNILSTNSAYGLFTGVSNSGDVWAQVGRNDGGTDLYSLRLQPNGGNVEIGYSADQGYKLAVNGSGFFNGSLTGNNVISTGNNGFHNDMYNVNVPNPIWSFGNSNQYGLAYYQGSALSVGDAIGFHFGDRTNPQFYVSAGGNVLAKGEVTAYTTSDKRLKKNIKPINNSLSIINKLNPVSYNWNEKAKELNPNKDNKKDVGVIAQELEKVLPNLVHNIYDDEQYLSVDYVKLIPYLIGAIQELTREINTLKNNK